MFTGLLHTHKLVVILFLLLYLIKTILLLANKKETLANFSKKLRIPEMIISVLFLLSGIVMLFQLPSINQFMLIKIVAVFASIPLAIIGFKKSNKILATLSLVLLIASYGLAEMSRRYVKKIDVPQGTITDISASDYNALSHGKALYLGNCVACHGTDGQAGIAGSKNLTITQLDEAGIAHIISNGKNVMPPYKKVFNDQEINALVKYVWSMKK
ncbi:MAG: SirB2 family protein [Thermoflexibacter sp.]|jgi:cytochrome c553|nr:SirB2 family protein [Thermoflexibacter sp.]